MKFTITNHLVCTVYSVPYSVYPYQAEVHTLNDQLESVKIELQTEKQKNKLSLISSSLRDGSSLESERLATLEIRELTERQRADLATTRSAEDQTLPKTIDYTYWYNPSILCWLCTYLSSCNSLTAFLSRILLVVQKGNKNMHARNSQESTKK